MHGTYNIMIEVGVSLFPKKLRSLRISDIYPYVL